eukprot:scaffold3573_cov153-Skeletonema_menzelii.AAC.5
MRRFAMVTIIASSSAFTSRRLMFRISRNYAAARQKNFPYHPNKNGYAVLRRASRSTTGCLPMLFSSLSFEMTANEIQMKDDALKMINASIRAVDPYAAVKKKMTVCKEGDSLETLVVEVDGDGAEQIKYDMSKYDRIRVFSFGKASAAMALAAGEVISSSGKQLDGVTIIKDDHATAEEIELLKEKYNIVVRPASHPVPDARSVAGSNEILQLAKISDSRTLIIACISGGGSALFCSPREPLTLEDLMQTNSALLASGMPIEKMNVIRKRLENGKGGRLAATAFPATVLTLVLSDIIGDPIDLIASGPTVPDDGSGWDDAGRLVKEYGLEADGEYALPDTVLKLLRLGKEGHLKDTPKSSHAAFCDSPPLCQTVLVGNNRAAVMAAANEADRLGWNPVVLGTRVDGEASIVAGTYVAMAEMLSEQRGDHGISRYQIAKLPAAIIAGGETVVTIPAGCNGKGGRNQELALSAAIKLKEIGLRDVVIASCGTDGTDGPTDAGGAIVDGASVDRIEKTISCRSAHDAMKNHDAYHFFHDATANDTSHHLIQTGPTGTNVADIMITLVK